MLTIFSHPALIGIVYGMKVDAMVVISLRNVNVLVC